MLAPAKRDELERLYQSLNPLRLRRELEAALERLWTLAAPDPRRPPGDTLRLLGEVASHHDRPDVATAEAHYGAAMALASDLGMRPLAVTPLTYTRSVCIFVIL